MRLFLALGMLFSIPAHAMEGGFGDENTAENDLRVFSCLYCDSLTIPILQGSVSYRWRLRAVARSTNYTHHLNPFVLEIRGFAYYVHKGKRHNERGTVANKTENTARSLQANRHWLKPGPARTRYMETWHLFKQNLSGEVQKKSYATPRAC